jgi:hypothetical protein
VLNPGNSMLSTLEKLIRQNVVLYFANRPAEEKTLEKVEAFAQKQLDFFINGMMKQSPDLHKAWRGGHPFMAKAAIHRETLSFEIKIVEKEPGKY